MILEGLVTTLNADSTPHLAPMGPRVDPQISRFTLRPFQSSTTFKNLKRQGEGVLHVTDDVELLARAAVGKVDAFPAWRKATAIQGAILADCCRWFEFRVVSLDDSAERTTIECEVVEQGRTRDFFGFNRAKHAVVEAAILATRLHLLPRDEIDREFQRLSILVQKTAGEQESRAFDFLRNHVAARLANVTEATPNNFVADAKSDHEQT